MVVTRGGSRIGEVEEGRGVQKYMETRRLVTSGGEHTIEYTIIILKSCRPAIYIMLLTNVNPKV